MANLWGTGVLVQTSRISLGSGETSHMGWGPTQPEDVGVSAKEEPLLVLIMLLGTTTQQALQVVLDDDEPIMQVENSLSEMTKSMSEVEEEVGEIKLPKKPTKKFQGMLEILVWVRG